MYTIPAAKATDPANRFEFELAGEARTAPLLEFVSFDVEVAITSARTLTEQRLAYIMALADGDEEAATQLRALGRDQITELIERYDEESEVTVGESGASTDS